VVSRTRARQEGFGLVEVVVALAVLLLVLVPAGELLANGTNFVASEAYRNQATGVANSMLACLQAQPITEVPACAPAGATVTGSPPAVVFDALLPAARGVGVPFKEQVTTTWVQAQGSTAATCLGASVVVSWSKGHAAGSVHAQALVDCEPAPTLNSFTQDFVVNGQPEPDELVFEGIEQVIDLDADGDQASADTDAGSELAGADGPQFADYGAKPGGTSAPALVAVVLVAPESGWIGEYALVGTPVVTGQDGSWFTIGADTCQGKLLLDAPPTASRCTLEVSFSPPPNAPSGTSVNTTIEIPYNGGSVSVPIVATVGS
jgi:type II secretory pathway pseudopilin PulG